MEAVLSLLRNLLGVIVGFFVLLGSVFTGGSATISTTSPGPAPIVATTTAAASSTPPTSLATSTPTKTAVKLTATPSPTPAKQVQLAATTPPQPQYTEEQLNALARGSLVNILCTTGGGGSFNPISGSGVIVDSRGIILTNAHVGQYFLLRDYPTANNVQCVVRVGSPAQPRYTAELLYLPPAWIAANAATIASTSPTGTGQNDYAFLRITGTTDPNGTLPPSFPSLAMTSADPDVGQQMLLAAYPAGFLGGISITLNLYITSAVATVNNIYAYSDNTHVDLFSLGGSVVSQSGSSGGAAVNGTGQLNGLIATEVYAPTTAARDLRAITIGHINRSLAAEGQGGILTLLSHDPAGFAADFAKNTAPLETKALEDALNRQ